MEWNEKIAEGMRLIIEGCKGNPNWCDCHTKCPFDLFCTSIYKDEDHSFSTPDTYEEEGLEI